MIYTINNFTQVKILPNSLYVFDIDETILTIKYHDSPEYKSILNKNLPIYNNDLKKANIHSFREYMLKDELHIPIPLDNDNFFNLINKIRFNNSKLIFLTARDSSLKKQTINHLEKIGLFINPDIIFFNDNKGDELLNIVNNIYKNNNLLNLKNIIFVDDVFLNLSDVQSKFCFSNYHLHLYLIKHNFF